MNAYAHDYPDEPGHRGIDTSVAAAEAMSSVSARYQRMALFAIQVAGARGLTAEELAARLGLERTTIQPRTTELRRRGLIRDSAQRRPNRNGHRAIVWIAVSNAGGARG